jgi:hypothetical protein
LPIERTICVILYFQNASYSAMECRSCFDLNNSFVVGWFAVIIITKHSIHLCATLGEGGVSIWGHGFEYNAKKTIVKVIA